MSEFMPQQDQTERLLNSCEYQIDYWLKEENPEAVEMYGRIRREIREEAGYEPDEFDRLFDE